VNESNACRPIDTAEWLTNAERMLISARHLRGLLEELAERWGLSEPELALLWACTRVPAGGLSQSALAEQLAVSPAHISGLVERLSRLGLLRGRRADGDRRRHLCELTPAGVAAWQAVLRGLSDADQCRGAA
jgi:DNA-binding MarR family transcriptional regulator